ncbi:polyprenol reductase, putative [Plasmodium knowlesi strain H]|uniref:Polyprenol reductase, putative n=3 Tax=Plasmodium knowlesi TaxID=5850 RepID=A0A5K1U2T6_PLAKH|nr:polyprenol reductase, putative [Plasmodium knowlesi strain H]OTN65407.1 putative 3-oxo-5-alpha-steroid 4-dehydrogenase [Plasmodium knowlesi]CAA9989587.1 polyprenol reductase, putative [Plasmodium knowlesi strain H]SBO22644.1 polyprenol reductase, putative [Plasmodium knowlesi strain H]SBO23394.1 polyprenol reductase, putative [Plasmodium knowlesi strain H]VVS79061.1 polyprenol reductase, putative [Plasmodium knowlesi strain H]|eukprot:XP_002260312.1 3-oxo-5-alpha-steroid 4-dehydrogenase, putative [Plasmodium knowlesi strain H]
MCGVSSLVQAMEEEGILKIICKVYYTVGCFVLLLSFHFKSINEWSLHGKNLYIKVEKGDADGEKWNSTFSKLRGKINHMTISKKHFSHFYVIGLVVNSALLICDLSQHAVSEQTVHHCISITNVLLHVQLLRRLFEQLFIVRTTPKSVMHVFSYLLGVTFYLVTPYSLQNNDKREYTLVGLLPVVVFLLGTLIQYDSHVRLAKLRPKGERKLDSPYKVPHGGLFYFVSCPHYFAEILIYLSFLLLNWNFISLLSFTFVFLVLIKNGLQTHKWYLRTAREAYPKQRRAIFPYIL